MKDAKAPPLPREPAAKAEKIQGDESGVPDLADHELDALLRSATTDEEQSHEALWRRIQELRALKLV